MLKTRISCEESQNNLRILSERMMAGDIYHVSENWCTLEEKKKKQTPNNSSSFSRTHTVVDSELTITAQELYLWAI